MPLTLLFLLLVQAPAPAAPPAADAPLTVCEVLRNLDKYRDKEVKIRGLVGGDRYTGYYVAENLEGRPCEKMQRKAKNWPGTIHLHWFGEEQNDKVLESFVSQRNRDPKDKSKQVAATITGTINTTRNFQIVKDMDGGYFGNAYGSNGQHPAQLVIRSIKDIALQ